MRDRKKKGRRVGREQREKEGARRRRKTESGEAK